MTRPEPTYQSSRRLTEIARSIHAVHHDYMTKRERDESRVNYTPGGIKDVRRADALPAFDDLKRLLGQGQQEAASAVDGARSRATAALHAVAPKLDAATAVIAVEAARLVAADPAMRGRLIELSRHHALDDADREIAALLVHLPERLTRLSAEDRDRLRVALVPDEAAALYTAKAEAEQIELHIGAVTNLIASHAGMSIEDMPRELSEVVIAAQAAASPNIEPRRDVRDEPEAPPAEPQSSEPATNEPADDEATEPETEEA